MQVVQQLIKQLDTKKKELADFQEKYKIRIRVCISSDCGAGLPLAHAPVAQSAFLMRGCSVMLVCLMCSAAHKIDNCRVQMSRAPHHQYRRAAKAPKGYLWDPHRQRLPAKMSRTPKTIISGMARKSAGRAVINSVLLQILVESAGEPDVRGTPTCT